MVIVILLPGPLVHLVLQLLPHVRLVTLRLLPRFQILFRFSSRLFQFVFDQSHFFLLLAELSSEHGFTLVGVGELLRGFVQSIVELFGTVTLTLKLIDQSLRICGA